MGLALPIPSMQLQKKADPLKGPPDITIFLTIMADALRGQMPTETNLKVSTTANRTSANMLIGCQCIMLG